MALEIIIRYPNQHSRVHTTPHPETEAPLPPYSHANAREKFKMNPNGMKDYNGTMT